MSQYGNYCILRAINHFTFQGEFTNVGVSLYNQDGNLIDALADTPDRAFRRGDLPVGAVCDQAYFLRAMQGYTTIKSLTEHQERFSYAMSYVQLHQSGSSVLEDKTLQQLFDRIVLGKERK